MIADTSSASQLWFWDLGCCPSTVCLPMFPYSDPVWHGAAQGQDTGDNFMEAAPP